MKVVIMAGGRGTRLSGLVSDIPKPMIPIAGKPVLEHELLHLKDYGLFDYIITVSHLSEHIINYFGDGSKLGINIKYYVEQKPLGNAGALFKIKDELFDDFLLINADSMFDFDVERFKDYHMNRGGVVTLFAHPNNHPYDSGLLITGNDNRVKRWLTCEEPRPRWYRNCVNAGIHMINPRIFDCIDIDPNSVGAEVDGKRFTVDLDRQILRPLCESGMVFCYNSPEYVRDIGTPERYKSVSKDFEEGRVNAKNLRNKQRAIFLDRDGTINTYVGFLRRIDDFNLLPGVSEAIRMINDAGFLAIVVTNQPVIARGEVTYEDLQEIHNKMETLLGEDGAYLDAIYCCPHHPDRGYEGEVIEYKIDCDCRKPKPGLLFQASSDYNIDLTNSWMIGDGSNDVKAGIAAGCQTVLIGSGEFGQTFSANSLVDAVKRILDR